MPELDDRLDILRDSLERTPWVAPVWGGLPKVPTREALPTAAAEFGYRLVVIPGTPSVAYLCLQDAAGAWEWSQVATGTP